MAQTTTITKPCDFCDKRGLPLLLVREAVAPKPGTAPISFEGPIPLGVGVAHYTKRILRTGYLYVYDLARQRWEDYFITADGYYQKLPTVIGPRLAPPTKPYNCPDQGHRPLASCVTISDPDKATIVWIGFSDVRWTPAVRARHECETYRRRHMTEVDVRKALKNVTLPHVRPIAQVSAVVAEYAMDAKKGAALFDWSPFGFDPRIEQSKSLLSTFDAMRRKQGLLVTIGDPAGIVQELALLMARNANLYLQNSEARRNLAASAAINKIEEVIRDNAVLAYAGESQRLAADLLKSNPYAYTANIQFKRHVDATQEVTAEEAKTVADAAWVKYANKFDDGARAKWNKDFQKKLAEYEQAHVLPLAEAHATFITSDLLATYFEVNYDRENAESGAVYTKVYTLCVTATQDKPTCAAVYDKWLVGDPRDQKNLLLQALQFNQTSISDAVGAATTPDGGGIKTGTTVELSWRSIPWDNLLGVYTKALDRLADATHDVVADCVVQNAGPLARLFGRIIDGKYGVRGPTQWIISLIAKEPVVLVKAVATRAEFREMLVKHFSKISAEPLSKAKLRIAINRQMQLLGIKGVKLEGRTERLFMAMPDRVVPASTTPLSAWKAAERMAGHLHTVAEIEALRMTKWQTAISANLRYGVVAAIVQALSLTKLWEDEGKALKDESDDSKFRLMAGVGALSATVVDIIASSLDSRAALKYGAGVTSSAAAIFRTIGRVAGAAAGLFVAFLDFKKAEKAINEKAGLGLITAYSASAFFGGVLSLLMACAPGALTIPIVGLLIFLIIGIGIAIEFMKDNPIQDWLERCPWGVLPNQRYPSMEIEQEQLKLACK